MKRLLSNLFAPSKHQTPEEKAESLPFPSWVAYEPDLIPPLALMKTEGIEHIEEWFRWAEEWSMLLRVYGKITSKSHVLEIGCGLGRVAFPLRYIIREGAYEGFDIWKEKIDFLTKNFHSRYSNFKFTWANIHNTHYNPGGQIKGAEYRFPYADNRFDLVYAASVFTHLLPDVTLHYFNETSRVLKPNGRAVFSFFVLDNYRPGAPRPLGFARAGFNFDHSYGSYGDEFAIANPQNVEEMTAYRRSLIERYANEAGLELAQDPVPGYWSGSHANWIGGQDMVVLRKK